MVKSVTPAGRKSGANGALRALKWASLGLVLPAAVVVGAWAAVHRVPGLGPWAADTLRGALGVQSVARLEDTLYGLEDEFNRYWHRGDTPQARWSVPATTAAALRPAPARSVESQAPSPTPNSVELGAEMAGKQRKIGQFRPDDIGPVLESWSAPGDGQWLPLLTLPGEKGANRGALYKTLLHPDGNRSWAELYVVAIDLRQVRLHWVAGSEEPLATTPAGLGLDRDGLIPGEHQALALAGFNGGFKTEHGQYGVGVRGITLIPANPGACTIVERTDRSLAIGSWARVQKALPDANWWRQTPNCMYEQGILHPRLAEGFVHQWGATLSGQTVIRRSAIGIDASGETLFVAISNHTTAPALALGMHHAGAETVAQLDVNHSYPKFLTFRDSLSSALRFAVPLADGFEYSEQEYLSKPSRRDFFYLTPRQVRSAQ